MTQDHQFMVTDAAISRLKQIIAKDKAALEGKYFRISVEGGGCSGFQYHLDFDAHRDEAVDVIFEYEGVQVIIDETSLGFLEGAKLDYVEDLMGSAFKMINPNAASSCGCGSSFSV